MSAMNPPPDPSLIQEVALATGMAESFVEKDWFVVQVIQTIGAIEHHGFAVVFSGGTALSKAHGLLQRFSEDVDFRIMVPAGFHTRKSLSGYRSAVVAALRHDGFAVEEANVRARDENRFFSIELHYESQFRRPEALRPHVQVELTAKDPQLPPRYLPVASFLHTLSKQAPEVARIGCIDPVESAADKLSALTWRIPDRVRGDRYDDPSLVRHIHDLAILKDRALAYADFLTLVKTSLEDDRVRAKNNPSVSGLPLVERLDLMMRTLESDAEYAVEYDRFVRGVSYATAEAIPSFEMAMQAVRELAEKTKGTR